MFFQYIWDTPLRYYQKFSIYYAVNALYYSIISFLVSYSLQTLRNILTKLCKKVEAPQLPLDPMFSNDNSKNRLRKRALWLSRFNKFLAFLQYISKFAGVFFISVIPGMFSGFNIYPLAISFFLTFFIYLFVLWLYLEEEIRKRKSKPEDGLHNRSSLWKTFSMSCERYPKTSIAFGALAIGLSILIPYAFKGTCICFYTEDYGFGVAGEDTTTTELYRDLFFDEQCPSGSPPCHVYATVPHDPSRYVFINVHAGHDVTSLSVYYDTQMDYENNNNNMRYSQDSYGLQMDFDSTGKRSMHSVLLPNLIPNTTYIFQVVYYGAVQYTGFYKTLSVGPSNVRIAMGGDVGSTIAAKQLTASLAKYNPDVIMIGGDAPYDNANSACWKAWDKFLEQYEDLNSQLNRLIPLVIGVGNHDVGFDAYTNHKIEPDNIPNFFYFLPQHLDLNDDGTFTENVPPVEKRKSYFYHIVGPAIFLALDSSYVVEYDDPGQMKMLTNVSHKYSDKGKFAYYHVPIYPTCLGDPDDTQAERENSQKVWSSVFEEYHFAGAFENHVHMFKQTFPLKQGKIDYDDGVVYFGDGNWGTIPEGCSDGDVLGVMETWSSMNSLWIIDMYDYNYVIYPIDPAGNKIFKATSGTFKLSETEVDDVYVKFVE